MKNAAEAAASRPPGHPLSPLQIQGLLALLAWTLWIWGMQHYQLWELFADKAFMSVTMVFGSFIAGATSEGGGAIAFPVMTLVFDIPPYVARDFSLMIQSVGMTAASVAIVLLRITVEWRAILFAGIGGAAGVLIGLEWIAPLLPASYTKTFFLSLWLSFAVALYWINRDREREVLNRIAGFGKTQAAILVGVGLVGGMVSGITGTGLDMLTFSVLVLLFSLNEKVATPTSVILMASNSLVGFSWLELGPHGVAEPAWAYWWVCVPVVVVGAPLGARFIRNRSRSFISQLLYVSIIAQYIGGLMIIPQDTGLLSFNAAVFMIGSVLFWRLAREGEALAIRRVSQPSPK